MDKRIRPHSRRHGRADRHETARVRAVIERANDAVADRAFIEMERTSKFPGVIASGTRAEWRAEIKRMGRTS